MSASPPPGEVFLSFEGRLDRDRWLLAAGVLLLANVAAFSLSWWLEGRGAIGAGARDTIRACVAVFTMVPWAAIDWKRMHDIDQPGRLALVCPALFVAARIWELPAVAALVPGMHGTVEELIAWAQFFLALFLAYAYIFITGTPGPNRFGEDPRGSASPESSPA